MKLIFLITFRFITCGTNGEIDYQNYFPAQYAFSITSVPSTQSVTIYNQYGALSLTNSNGFDSFICSASRGLFTPLCEYGQIWSPTLGCNGLPYNTTGVNVTVTTLLYNLYFQTVNSTNIDLAATAEVIQLVLATPGYYGLYSSVQNAYVKIFLQ